MMDAVTAAREAPTQGHPGNVLLAEPTHFRVEEVLNPHMLDASGDLRRVDAAEATRQWRDLKAAYEKVGLRVHVLETAPALPDQVFVANPVLAGAGDDGAPVVLPSRMTHGSRAPEVDAVVAWFRARGHRVLEPPRAGVVEGAGDLLWLADRRALVAGYGFRSNEAAVREAARSLEAPVVTVRLVDDRFYHLDTALAVLDATTALWVPDAFDEAGRATLGRLFDNLITVPEDEALRLAANAHAPDGRHVLLEASCTVTADLLRDRGFHPLPVDTSEFLKSGGSVYCLKQTFW